jgi:hypothetical protein
MIEAYGELCIWRDLYQIFRDREIGTTFESVHDVDHPLYKCTLCLGYNKECTGYAPLDSELRKIVRNRRL